LSGKVPDEFFDAEVEKEKEFLDIATSISQGGLEQVTVVKVSRIVPHYQPDNNYDSPLKLCVCNFRIHLLGKS
jgi:hypothetical protein